MGRMEVIIKDQLKLIHEYDKINKKEKAKSVEITQRQEDKLQKYG